MTDAEHKLEETEKVLMEEKQEAESVKREVVVLKEVYEDKERVMKEKLEELKVKDLKVVTIKKKIDKEVKSQLKVKRLIQMKKSEKKGRKIIPKEGKKVIKKRVVQLVNMIQRATYNNSGMSEGI